ncbi:hypothetical protein PVIIG_06176 [Plasmodium vivax India VII]|uniref:VIR protein n=1 Tax=Plasmodium vivax India VII TaxID=1077284 RepID=A0A0J9S2F1_PLAVI|nr:hypothetical protein PVIIG_06176 [Plasmodium vivax India VII]
MIIKNLVSSIFLMHYIIIFKNNFLYEFFEDIENYIKISKSAENTDALSIVPSGCNSFMQTYGHYFNVQDRAKEICKEFIKLYNSLTDLNCNSNSDPNYKKCRNFLNFWVNFKLIGSMKNEDRSVSTVYDLLEGQTTDRDFSTNLVCIHDINKNDFNKMNILYKLYKIYTDINSILENEGDMVKRTLLSYSSACCTDYLVANYLCNGENNEFCTQLENFKTKYDLLYNTEIEKKPEYKNYFKKLSECDNNTMLTALIGTTVGLVPLLFTPLRQLINSKNGKFTQEHRNNDDEIRNIMLMDQGSEHISSQQGTYNIKYHSV